jgi:hypothetical protein
MIEFDDSRVEPVRAFLKRLGALRDGDTYLIYKVVSQSFKVIHAQADAAHLVAAIGFLFTGSPADFDTCDPREALSVAKLIFLESDPEHGAKSLLFEHTERIMWIAPRRGESRRPWSHYIDFERDHLALLGGRLLFLRIVEVLTAPYTPQADWADSISAVQLLEMLPHWIRPDVIRKGIEGRRHWQCWADGADRFERQKGR